MTEVSPRTFWSTLALVLIVGIGIIANPLVTRPETVYTGVLAGEGIAALLLLAYEILRARWHKPTPPLPDSDDISIDSSRRGVGWLTPAVFGVVLLLWAVEFRERWGGMRVHSDDGYYLGHCTDWETTRESLFRPYHEHYIVPQRLLTFLVVRAGQTIGQPHAMQLAGTVLFLIALLLLFNLSRRALQSDFGALLAVTFFALSTAYSEVVNWYSASLWLVTFNLLLASCCLIETTNDEPSKWRLLFASGIALVAPYSYSLGLVVGPLTSVWLWARVRAAGWGRRCVIVLLPSFGTMLGVCLLLPGLLAYFATDEYIGSGSRDSLQKFDPFGGGEYAVRLVMDMLVMRNLGGVFSLKWWWLYAVSFPVLVLALRQALRRNAAIARMMAPALAMIVVPYAATLPFRTYQQYFEIIGWDRYQLIPQLGVALLLAGLMISHPPRQLGHCLGRLTIRQAGAVVAIALLLVGLHEIEKLQIDRQHAFRGLLAE